MEQIASDGRRSVYLRVLQPDEPLAPPFGGAAYPALIWAALSTTPAQKEALCAGLIDGNCRYAVFGGDECAAWESCADEVFAAQDLTEGEFEERHVMTTSHPHESPEDVASFFLRCTTFDTHDFTRYLVVLIGEDAGVRERLAAALRAEMHPPPR